MITFFTQNSTYSNTPYTLVPSINIISLFFFPPVPPSPTHSYTHTLGQITTICRIMYLHQCFFCFFKLFLFFSFSLLSFSFCNSYLPRASYMLHTLLNYLHFFFLMGCGGGEVGLFRCFE